MNRQPLAGDPLAPPKDFEGCSRQSLIGTHHSQNTDRSIGTRVRHFTENDLKSICQAVPIRQIKGVQRFARYPTAPEVSHHRVGSLPELKFDRLASKLGSACQSGHHQMVQVLKRRAADPNSSSGIGLPHNRTITFLEVRSRSAVKNEGQQCRFSLHKSTQVFFKILLATCDLSGQAAVANDRFGQRTSRSCLDRTELEAGGASWNACVVCDGRCSRSLATVPAPASAAST